jgi:hypothetical protein
LSSVLCFFLLIVFFFFFLQRMLSFEASFVNASTVFSAVPVGDAVDVSFRLREKYAGIVWTNTTSAPFANKRASNPRRSLRKH